METTIPEDEGPRPGDREETKPEDVKTTIPVDEAPRPEDMTESDDEGQAKGDGSRTGEVEVRRESGRASDKEDVLLSSQLPSRV